MSGAESPEYVVWERPWRPTDAETSESFPRPVEIMLVLICGFSWEEGPLLSLLSFKGFQTLAEARKHSKHVAGNNCTKYPRDCAHFLWLPFCSLMLLPARLAVSLPTSLHR